MSSAVKVRPFGGFGIASFSGQPLWKRQCGSGFESPVTLAVVPIILGLRLPGAIKDVANLSQARPAQLMRLL